MKHEEDLSEKQTILKAVVLIAIPLALIFKEPIFLQQSVQQHFSVS